MALHTRGYLAYGMRLWVRQDCNMPSHPMLNCRGHYGAVCDAESLRFPQ